MVKCRIEVGRIKDADAGSFVLVVHECATAGCKMSGWMNQPNRAGAVGGNGTEARATCGGTKLFRMEM